MNNFAPVCKAPKGKGPRTKKQARRLRERNTPPREPKRVTEPEPASRVALVAGGRVLDVKPF